MLVATSRKPAYDTLKKVESLLGFAAGKPARISIFLQGVFVWTFVWHLGLERAFQGLIPEQAEMYTPISPGWVWYYSHLPVLMVWNLLLGAVVVWIYVDLSSCNDLHQFKGLSDAFSVLPLSLIVAVLNIWLITLLYIGAGNGGGALGFFTAIAVVILGHALLVGFILSISTAFLGAALGGLWVLAFFLLRAVIWGGLKLIRRGML